MKAVRLGVTRFKCGDCVRELGVDEPVNYTAVPFEKAGKPVDVVFDTLGDDIQALLESAENGPYPGQNRPGCPKRMKQRRTGCNAVSAV